MSFLCWIATSFPTPPLPVVWRQTFCACASNWKNLSFRLQLAGDVDATVCLFTAERTPLLKGLLSSDPLHHKQQHSQEKSSPKSGWRIEFEHASIVRMIQLSRPHSNVSNASSNVPFLMRITLASMTFPPLETNCTEFLHRLGKNQTPGRFSSGTMRPCTSILQISNYKTVAFLLLSKTSGLFL